MKEGKKDGRKKKLVQMHESYFVVKYIYGD